MIALDRQLRQLAIGGQLVVALLVAAAMPASALGQGEAKPTTGSATPAPTKTTEIRGVGSPQSEIKVIGSDGKELKNIKIIIGTGEKPSAQAPTIWMVGPDGKQIQLRPGDPKVTQPDLLGALRFLAIKPAPLAIKPITNVPGAVTLSRVTYKLPKEKAEALAAFLKANVHPSVLEFRTDEGGLTVTTTPEAQSTIHGIVTLMQAKNDKTD